MAGLQQVPGRLGGMVRETVVDKVVAYFAPAVAVERRRARVQLAMTSGLTGSYVGARKDRRQTKNWSVSAATADQDLIPDLPTLRERSRDMERNEPFARGALDTKVMNVVGPGLDLLPEPDRDALGLTAEQAEAWADSTRREFRLWEYEADLAGQLHFKDMQDLALRSIFVNGDLLTVRRFRRDPGDIYGLALQLLEADRLSNPGYAADTAGLRGGVVIDGDGQPMRYYVTKEPAGTASARNEWAEFPAYDAAGRRLILHTFRARRVGQHRGEPMLAPVIEPLKMLGRYSNAELMAAVVNSFFAIITKTDGGTGLAPADGASSPGASERRPEIDVEEGAIVELSGAEDVKSFTPARPSASFDPFVQAVLRQVGVALELPFEVLIKHFTSSYSAARGALLEAWKSYRSSRAWFARAWCDPVYEWFLWEAVARGRVVAPGFLTDAAARRAWCGAVWLGPSPGQIDPTKETKAAVEKIDAGLSTLKRETAELGTGDWRANHEQRVIEQGARRTGGLLPPSPASPDTAPPPDAPDATDAADNQERSNAP